MESHNTNRTGTEKKFQLYERPWLSLLAVMLTSVLAIMLTGTVIFGWIGLPDDVPAVQFLQAMCHHLLFGFVLAPFVLRLPKGRRTFRQYLDDIGLSKVQPFFRLVVLAISCSLILALCQAAASFLYRMVEGQPVSWGFVQQVFDLSGDLPPASAGLLTSFPSMFEEVAFRGILLTVFLRRYSAPKAIAFSSAGFGLIHLLNIFSGRELVWVLGQVVWAFLIGLFYGYVFIKTGSLLPPMIVHYLGNLFIGSLTAYLQQWAPVETQALYGILLSFGIVPTTLMIGWTRFFTSRWLPQPENHPSRMNLPQAASL